jgi:hypothetical protein
VQVSTVEEEIAYNPRLSKDKVITNQAKINSLYAPKTIILCFLIIFFLLLCRKLSKQLWKVSSRNRYTYLFLNSLCDITDVPAECTWILD